MAGELQFPNESTGETLYAVLRNSSGQAIIISSGAAANYATANLSSYAITLTEQGTASRFYVGNMPANVAAGDITATVYKRAGESPAEGDLRKGHGAYHWNGTALVPISSLATAVSVAALPAAVWAALTSALTTVGSIGKKLADAVFGATVTVTPLSVTVSAGEVSGSDLVAYQFCAFSFLLTITDDNGAAVSLAGKNVAFVLTKLETPTVEVWRLTNGSGLTIVGASNNQLSVVGTDTRTQDAGTFLWFAKNTTDDTPLARGSFTIHPAPVDA